MSLIFQACSHCLNSYSDSSSVYMLWRIHFGSWLRIQVIIWSLLPCISILSVKMAFNRTNIYKRASSLRFQRTWTCKVRYIGVAAILVITLSKQKTINVIPSRYWWSLYVSKTINVVHRHSRAMEGKRARWRDSTRIGSVGEVTFWEMFWLFVLIAYLKEDV